MAGRFRRRGDRRHGRLRSENDWLPFAVPLVLAGVPGVLFYSNRAQEMAERRAAFSTYPRDLGARLDVCAHELRVVPCEDYPAPSVPPLFPKGPR